MKRAGILRRIGGAAVAAVLLTFVSLPAPAADGPEPYLIGPRDRLMIRIGQWQAAEGAFTGWDDLTGEYGVSAAGTLSLPLLGSVEAAGRRPDELAAELSSALETRLGLADPVAASVEVAEYRPVFVTGAVARPGAFPWQPGLTVIQAIGLAGGLQQADSIFLRSERNALGALGDYEVYRLRLWRTLARRARLEAEIEGAEAIEIPDRLQNAPMANALIQTEREIMEARAEALESSRTQIESLERLLSRQIETLGKQIDLRERQVRLARQELEGVSELMSKGLTVQSRQNAIERTVADLESQKLNLETARLEAQQRLNEAERDRSDLMNEHRREVVTELAEARGATDELEARIETQRGLYAEAARLGTGHFQLGSAGVPDFVRLRPDDQGGMSSDTVPRTALLRPGDVLEVRPPELEGVPTAPPGSLNTSSLPPPLQLRARSDATAMSR